MLDAAADWRDGVRWVLALGLGLRQGEALGLLWRRVDLGAGVLRVAWQLQQLRWQHGCDDLLPQAAPRRWLSAVAAQVGQVAAHDHPAGPVGG